VFDDGRDPVQPLHTRPTHVFPKPSWVCLPPSAELAARFIVSSDDDDDEERRGGGTIDAKERRSIREWEKVQKEPDA